MTETLIVVAATAVVMICFGIAVREWEIGAQRRERHRLKNENAALRLLLEANGIAIPGEND